MDVAPLLSNLPHSWEDDPREPFLTFSYKHQKFGLYLPEIIQNVEVAVVLGATVLVAAAISLLIFKYILSPSTYRNSTLACCLLGYGIIVPFWILVPVYAVKILNIRNKVFRFVFGTVPTLSFFRTFEGK